MNLIKQPDLIPRYMRPGTPHFVLGAFPTIVLGRHYYAAGCIQRSCYSIVYTVVMGLGLTNTFHDDRTRSMLRQLMALTYRHYILEHGFGCKSSARFLSDQAYSVLARKAHVPDMSTRDGLLDVIAMGCVLKFTTALSHERYHRAYDASTDDACADRQQENLGRTYFRVLMKVFATKYHLFVGNVLLHGSYIWHSVMVRFAASLVAHMKSKKKAVTFAPGMSITAVEDALRLHLSEDHPHLVEPFNLALTKKDLTSLTWGSDIKFEIVPKSKSSHHLLRTLGVHEEVDEMSVEPTMRKVGYGRGGATALNEYYRGLWQGENIPLDDAEEST